MTDNDTTEQKGYEYECPFCKYSTDSNVGLQTHGRSEHPEKTLYVNPWQDPEVLDRLYYQQEMTYKEMGNVLGTTPARITEWMSRHDMSPGNTTKAMIQARRNSHASYDTHPVRGYERCRSRVPNEPGKLDQVKVHRLAAVAWFGFDEVCDSIVHHGPINIPWANWEENLQVMTQPEHIEIHEPHKH